MARLLMHLRHVPEDEYAEVAALLDRHGLAHYRIEPNRWGLHGGSLWLEDDSRYDQARALLADYQHDRAARARADYQAARAAGTAPGLLDQLRAQPLRTLALVVALLVVIAISVLPFVWLMGRG